MFKIRLMAMAAVGLLTGSCALASAANHLVADYGDLTVPFTHSIGDTFSGSQAGGFVSQDGLPVVTVSLNSLNYFYDDFTFTLPSAPQTNFDAAAVTIDVGTFLGLQNFSARLYKLDSGLVSLTTGLPSSGAPVYAWTSTSMLAPGITSTVVLFQSVPLQAGASYALELRGTIDGAAGGSYGGNLNITPVPEPGSLALLGASFGVMALVSRRRKS